MTEAAMNRTEDVVTLVLHFNVCWTEYEVYY